MTGARSKALSPERRAQLADSFARSLADPTLTEREAAACGLKTFSYKSLRGRWEARGRTWPEAPEAPRPMRAGVRRALERERPTAAAGPARPAAAPRAAAPPAGAALVPLVVTAGEMLTTAATAAVGRFVLHADPADIAAVSQPDEDGRKRLESLAGPLAEYLDSRLGAAGEHAPLIAFGLAIGGGVCTRTMMLSAMTRERRSLQPKSSDQAAPDVSTRGASPPTGVASYADASPPPAVPVPPG